MWISIQEYFLTFSPRDVWPERTIDLMELLSHTDKQLVFSLSPSELVAHDYFGLVKTQSQIVMMYTNHLSEFSKKKSKNKQTNKTPKNPWRAIEN